MENMSPEQRVALSASAAILTVALVLQRIIAPEQAAWGLIELIGFGLAAIPLLMVGVFQLIDWLRE